MIENGRKQLAGASERRKRRFLLEMIAKWGQFDGRAHMRVAQVGVRMGFLGKCGSVPPNQEISERKREKKSPQRSAERQTISVSQSEASRWWCNCASATAAVAAAGWGSSRARGVAGEPSAT